MKAFLRKLLSIDARWSRNGKHILWTDGTFQQVYFLPKLAKKICSPCRTQTLRTNLFVTLLLPHAQILHATSRLIEPVHYITTADVGDTQYEVGDPWS